ncbi:MAG: VWA domain-containing protein [Acidobacteriota bacterium]|jgi:VWFA-related protein
MLPHQFRIQYILVPAILCCALSAVAQAPADGVRFEFKPDQSVYILAAKTSTRIELELGDKFFLNAVDLSCGSVVKNVYVPRSLLTARPSDGGTLEGSDLTGSPMISTDSLVKTSIEDAFRTEKKFKIADTADSSDFVFFAFSDYPFSSGLKSSTRYEEGTLIHDKVGGTVQDIILSDYGADSPYATDVVAVFGFVLSTPVFRQVRKDVVALSNAALWQGYVQSITPAARCNYPAQQPAASELVKKFHEDVLKSKKPVRTAAPQRAQAGTDKNAPALKTPDQPPVPTALPPVSKDTAAIKVETSLVTVPVIVLERGGRFVANLTQQDFHVFEDDVEQKIDHFSTTEAPFNVVVLLDASASMRLQGTDVQRAATAFVKELHQQDLLSVVSVNSEIYVNTDFTSDRALLETGILQARKGSGTRLYDAVDLVLTKWLSRVEERKAIVLFSDGVDTESRLTDAGRSLELAEESGALIYTIRYDTANDVPRQTSTTLLGNVLVAPGRSNVSVAGAEAYREASLYLSALAEHTGARGFQAKTIGDLDQAFSQVAEDLRQQYELTYYPANTARDGAYRHIRIQVDRPDVVVRARPGYRAAQTPTTVK